MRKGINKVILVGNCGNDPEVRATNAGKSVTNISVATSESWNDESGNLQERTEWHKIVFFGRLAEIAGEYLKKGSKVYIEGSLRTRKWKDQQDVERYTTEIIASEMQIVDSRNTANSAPQNASPAPQVNQQVDPKGFVADFPNDQVGGFQNDEILF